MRVNMYEAKTKLSSLVEAAMKGEEVIIAKANKPMVKLVPCGSEKRVLGGYDIEIAHDFDDIDDEIIKMFEGK